jgi:hypothetical protein
VAELPEELQAALEADDAGELGDIIRRGQPEHLAALKELVAETDADAVLLARAIYALGAWGDTGAAPLILSRMDGLDNQGRLSALNALGRLNVPEGLDVLIDATRDESPQIRKIAVSALARSDSPRATTRLEELASDDPTDWIRADARRALVDR